MNEDGDGVRSVNWGLNFVDSTMMTNCRHNNTTTQNGGKRVNETVCDGSAELGVQLR